MNVPLNEGELNIIVDSLSRDGAAGRLRDKLLVELDTCGSGYSEDTKARAWTLIKEKLNELKLGCERISDGTLYLSAYGQPENRIELGQAGFAALAEIDDPAVRAVLKAVRRLSMK